VYNILFKGYMCTIFCWRVICVP